MFLQLGSKAICTKTKWGRPCVNKSIVIRTWLSDRTTRHCNTNQATSKLSHKEIQTDTERSNKDSPSDKKTVKRKVYLDRKAHDIH